MAKWSGDGGTKKKTKDLVGSKSCDCFKSWHKTLDRSFYSSDVDLLWVSKDPPGIVAALDYKAGDYDRITFAETILYSTFLKMGIPVFIVTSDWRGSAAFTHFKVEKFVSGDWRQDPPAVKLKHIGDFNQKQFEAWERGLRSEFTKRHGG